MEPPAYTGGHGAGSDTLTYGLRPAMEPPAYTGGHVNRRKDEGDTEDPAMEPPAYTGGHVRLAIDLQTIFHPQWSLRLTPEDTRPVARHPGSSNTPAMEPPAYTGGHGWQVCVLHQLVDPAMEPPAYTGGHVQILVKLHGDTQARNGASGLHRRTRCVSDLLPTKAIHPQWSLRLTPEDTRYPTRRH